MPDEARRAPSDDELRAAAVLALLEFDAAEREQMREQVGRFLDHYRALRSVPLDNGVPPALGFAPWRSLTELPSREGIRVAPPPDVKRPDDLETVAYWPVTHLAELVRSRQVSSRELTEMYLDRLTRYGPQLACVVTITGELAREQAERADEEIARGAYRGPLHGIPWGAKDLLAVAGYRTTWGAEPYREQVLDRTAVVVERLARAGAVLVAKLSLGALAMGDWWFAGQTKSPWDLDKGSSGSSAGSAAAVAAGLVPFAIGSETMGSIVSPSARCGVAGLRPTFGRVPRHGAMALAWSMDKLGPMARTADDCAAVLAAIHGRDPRDPDSVDVPLHYDAESDLASLRIGYVAPAFEGDHPTSSHDRAALDALARIGVELVPIELPRHPGRAFMTILLAEAAAAFDELTRTGEDDRLTRQTDDSWPNLFRAARLVPAVEYIRANRVRQLALEAMNDVFEAVDVYLCPSTYADNLYVTNVTGHPAVAVPHALDELGAPLDATMTFTAGLYREGDALRVAHAFQTAAGVPGRPALFP